MKQVMDMLKVLVAAGIDFTFTADPGAPRASAVNGAWDMTPSLFGKNVVMLWVGNSLQMVSIAQAVDIIRNI